MGVTKENPIEAPTSKKLKLPTFDAPIPKCPRVKHTAQRTKGAS